MNKPDSKNIDNTKIEIDSITKNLTNLKINVNNSDFTYNLLIKLLETKTPKEISQNLDIAVGTVKRWIELKSVPKLYCFELMKLCKINIDYSHFSFKEKDQFFTPTITANYCYNKCLEILKYYNDSPDDYIYIEPSAGDGSFFNITLR